VFVMDVPGRTGRCRPRLDAARRQTGETERTSDKARMRHVLQLHPPHLLLPSPARGLMMDVRWQSDLDVWWRRACCRSP
jgi:hypothetical protein